MSHFHCIFCGRSSDSLSLYDTFACCAPENNMPSDTVGNKPHVFPTGYWIGQKAKEAAEKAKLTAFEDITVIEA